MIYFIDPAKGSDGFAGTSEAMAWKHAPGDPRAVGWDVFGNPRVAGGPVGALGVLAP